METSDKRNEESRQPFSASGERLVYVIPEEALNAYAKGGMNLLELWNVLWRGKWLIICITTIIALLSIAYALTATEWYRADVLLAPSEPRSSQGISGALGGLASLAGVSVGGADDAQVLAILRSRDFTREFIEAENLLPILFSDSWDAETQTWMGDDNAGTPDIRDAVRFFNNNVRNVSVERDTGLVTLSIEWKDPELAAHWANVLVTSLNERIRMQSLSEARANVAYLQAELGKTNILTLQQSIGRLLERELEKLMLARGNEEFAFRIVDPPQVPKIRSRPRRSMIVILATFVGGLLAVLLVVGRHVALADRAQAPRTVE